jgi:hypothetical protein
MAFYNNRIRLPIPGGTSSQGFSLPQTQGQQVRPIASPVTQPLGSVAKQPYPGFNLPGTKVQSPWEKYAGDFKASQNQPAAAPTPKLEVSPFMTNMYKSIQNIDPEQRAEYLSTTAASIKERLDKYEFRIARGIPLTPEQQRQYDSIRGAYNDIQKYVNNPQPYDQLFSQQAANVESARLNQDQDYQRRLAEYRALRIPTIAGGTAL